MSRQIIIALIMTVLLWRPFLCAETINIIPTSKDIKVEDGCFFAGKASGFQGDDGIESLCSAR